MAEVSTSKHSRRPQPPPWWSALGLVLILAGMWALVQDLEVWNAVWYVPAWYGYLLLIDGLIYCRSGASFLSHRRRELAAMLFWSVPFWFLFEAYNLVIQNWYYVFGLRNLWTQTVVTWVAFATVLPACFFHAELLRHLGAWRRTVTPPVRISRAWFHGLLIVGLILAAAPLVWPRHTFWAVWIGLFCVPEAINYRLGAPSLLRDVESGDWDRVIRLFVGGLWAGAVWELFNYWARCKWIYSVPGFEEWKLFEMPLAGFLGFPFLALEAFAVYALLCHFVRGGRHWERADDQGQRRVHRARYALLALLAVLLSVMVFGAVQSQTVRSRRPLLAELNGLLPPSVARLRAADVPTPERLFREVRRFGVTSIAQRSGVDATILERAVEHAAVALHKGMGTERAMLLRAAGIQSVSDLSSENPDSLFQRLSRLAADSGQVPPRRSEVKVWVRAARASGETRR